jgi:cytokinin dehydrogenase
MDRRGELSQNAHSTGIWYDPAGGLWVTAPIGGGLEVPDLDGRLSLDVPSREAASADWGGAVRSLPSAVLHAASVGDVVKMVRFCRSCGISIGARGEGHTMYGHSQVAAGVVIAMTSLNRIHSIDSDRACVEGGATWRELLTATVARGLTPPVLTDYLSLSVGGTLSVGGVNGTSYRYGTQGDNVLALDVVTGDGHVITCSPSQHRDLFEAVLGGLGQFGIIVGASISLIRAPSDARVFDPAYADLESLLADFRTLLADERFSYMEGLIRALPGGGFAYVLEAVSFYEESPPDDSTLLRGLSFIPGGVKVAENSYFDFCDRVTPREVEQRALGRWDLPHPWVDMFVPDGEADAFIGGIVERLSFEEIPDFPCLIYGYRKSRLTRPLPRTPDAEMFFEFDVLRTTEPARVSQAVAENRKVYDAGHSVGGRLYPIGAVPLSPEDWKRHLEPHYEDLTRAKARYDPGGILTPGPSMFGSRPQGRAALRSRTRPSPD